MKDFFLKKKVELRIFILMRQSAAFMDTLTEREF